MTFLTELSRLREAATKGKVSLTDAWLFVGDNKYPIANFNFGASEKADREFLAYLVNHAEAIEGLVRAILPLAHYSKMRDEKPMNGMDDAIHSIHVGTEWEAELTQSQLRSLRQALEKLNRSE